MKIWVLVQNDPGRAYVFFRELEPKGKVTTKVKVTKALYIKKINLVLHTRVIAQFEGPDKLNKYYIATYGQK